MPRNNDILLKNFHARHLNVTLSDITFFVNFTHLFTQLFSILNKFITLYIETIEFAPHKMQKCDSLILSDLFGCFLKL